jgi:hypothetical protein
LASASTSIRCGDVSDPRCGYVQGAGRHQCRLRRHRQSRLRREAASVAAAAEIGAP